MGSIEAPSFSAPPQVVTADGLLFDFDGTYTLAATGSDIALRNPDKQANIVYLVKLIGTIIDSTEAVVKYWHKQAALMGVDPDVILATSHGRRSIDTFQIYDPSKANWECE